ncbi:alpha/beta fold hydrolase [Sphaerisporangium perillae]|uniref:alpha/beta fold hydrolase n=1 Tax=Sphaerisporangium perillae TaxID=2935860 RepID=UPI0035579B57
MLCGDRTFCLAEELVQWLVVFRVRTAPMSIGKAVVKDVLRSINGPIILVGHSYGGLVISNAASAIPTSRPLVYVAAWSQGQHDEHEGATGPVSWRSVPQEEGGRLTAGAGRACPLRARCVPVRSATGGDSRGLTVTRPA